MVRLQAISLQPILVVGDMYLSETQTPLRPMIVKSTEYVLLTVFNGSFPVSPSSYVVVFSRYRPGSNSVDQGAVILGLDAIEPLLDWVR